MTCKVPAEHFRMKLLLAVLDPSPELVFKSDLLPGSRAPKDHVDTRILESMISGILLILGLGTGM